MSSSGEKAKEKVKRGKKMFAFGAPAFDGIGGDITEPAGDTVHGGELRIEPENLSDPNVDFDMDGKVSYADPGLREPGFFRIVRVASRKRDVE